jgi:hypothetical protein
LPILKDGIALQFVNTHNRRSPMHSRAHAALASISSGAAPGTLESSATRHPAFPLRTFSQSLTHRVCIEHTPSASLKEWKATCLQFTSQPSARESQLGREFIKGDDV